MSAEDRAFEIGECEIRLADNALDVEKAFCLDGANVVLDKGLAGHGYGKMLGHVDLPEPRQALANCKTRKIVARRRQKRPALFNA